ncbi:sugar phosphate isomerase/epimerase [Chitinophaga sp. S165]|uniref:sugar phosphate isomerase/epimerase family protein n=1 Tax=Chitinophaga sp. S165 TaxID=2135462 RepID=UPI000D712B2B|nr:sugar phosphate isomerase/epimerase family protein [Chitinophaga sp. S165]PWV50645.1 sugar phosphate isomerase/epimerase [Chitinophaga sp. S165]
MAMMEKTNRRRFLGNAALLAGGMLLPEMVFAAFKKDPKYRIAVCDWMILKRQKLGAFQLTKDIGADGVEVDMGGLGNRPTFDSKLSDPVVRQQFLDTSKSLNVAISSMAMSGFYAQSFAERPEVEKMVQDCIDTMVQMNIKVAFLPLGVQVDLVKRPDLRPVVIQRLKKVGANAEKAGVIIGVETALPAVEEAKLLDEIGSPAVKSYFNFSNALQAGRDLSQELKTLGAKRICQIHCTDTDGVWLQNNTRINMKEVKKTLDKMHWSGWLVIERSRDANDPRNVKKNFSANAAYMKSVFQ